MSDDTCSIIYIDYMLGLTAGDITIMRHGIQMMSRCYDTYADHPIDKLCRADVSVGVDTDIRTITNIPLSQEYEKLKRVLGWEKEHFLHCNLNALQPAFIPVHPQEELISRLMDAYE